MNPLEAAFAAEIDKDGQVPAHAKSMFVLQGECALFRVEDFEYCGSEDATTCVILVLVGAGHCFVTHVDDSIVGEPLQLALGKCTAQSKQRAQLFLAGAYNAGGNRALEHIRQTLVSHEMVDCVFNFTGAVNRDARGFPRTRALCIHLPTMRALPHTFENRGPELPRRHASRLFIPGLRLVNEYDTGNIILEEFTIPRLSAHAIALYGHLIHQAGEDPRSFLENTSTSPEHESERFIPDIAASFLFILEHGASGDARLPPQKFVFRNGEWVVVN